MNKGTFRGIKYDSKEEYHFLNWAFELKDLGYITRINRAVSFPLTNDVKISYKEGNKNKSFTLLRGSKYTPEFDILWSSKAHSLVYSLDIGTGKPNKLLIGIGVTTRRTLIEVKPTFDYKNMTRLFTNNQKFLYHNTGLYVNLVKIPDLFEKTFYPDSWFVTPTGKVRSRIGKISSREFIESLNDKNNNG